MSMPRKLWWGYVKAVIRAYPAREKKPPAAGQAAREFQAVRRAYQQTQALPDGGVRLRVIRSVFWRKSHTLDGAALAYCAGSYATAKRIQRDFILLVAREMGFEESPP